MLWHDPTSIRRTRRSSSSTSATSSRRSPARAARRIACRSRTRRSRSSRRSTRSASTYANGSPDKALADTFPASDPTTEQQPGGEPEPVADAATVPTSPPSTRKSVPVRGEDYSLEHGSVVIAAITSCTNTSNPSVMIGAGLLAKKAVEKGLKRKPWVKSSLAPGSKVVTDYYARAGLDAYLDELGFNLVGYGCTTCIGNSGPLPDAIGEAIDGRRAHRLRRALRQPQLRGAHPLRREGELPRLAAARRRLRARRPHGHRPDQRAARRRQRRARLPARHLADRRRDRRDDRAVDRRRDVQGSYGDVFDGRRALARARDAVRRPLRVGARLDVHAAAAVLRRDAGEPGTGRGHRRRARARDARRLRHDRSHLAGRRDPARLARRGVPDRARRRAARRSTRTARGAATTR